MTTIPRTVSLADKPWLKSYEEGVPHTIEVPDFPLFHFLEESARKYPDNAALIFKGRRMSYKELNALSDAVAAALAANGFKKGDRAVIFMPNCPQFIISYYGILKAGGIVIATNPLYSDRELEHQLVDCGAETIFVLSLFYAQLKRVQPKTNIKRVIVANIKDYLSPHLKMLFTLLKEKKEGHRVELEAGDMRFTDFVASGRNLPKPNVKVTGEDVALLQYTGGTTGLAKGAVGLHRNMGANVIQMKAWFPGIREGGESVLAALPLFHSYGMITALHLPVSLGGTIVLVPNPRDQADMLGSINKYKPTLFPGVPAMYVAINNNPDVAAGKYDVRSIRACISGAAPLLLETKERFEELTGGKLVEGFGLTEAMVATHANPIYGENRPGSIGLPLPNNECRIVDAENPERELGIGEIGELVIKGPTIMEGYWNMPDETAKSLVDGWLYTGDIAECDEDGWFYIRDRKKDMIIAGGYNIYPREVEEELARHPAVLEVAVAGIPDERRGETVKAWIVKKPGDPTTEEQIIEWSKGELARYKYPRMVEFIDELPKSTALKVLKRELVREHIEKHGG